MMDIYIKNINLNNNKKIKNIELKSSQIGFIESVEECLDEAKINSNWVPVSIYLNSEVIGFAMYGFFEDEGKVWIDRIMIDKKYQGFGYGRQAMNLLISIVFKKYNTDNIYLSIINGNIVAKKLYESLGFVYTLQKDQNGEFIYKFQNKEL
ncbi:N-acetyltransferase (plasmid) [Mammaliicoccus sciuri]|uniref:N-acetyltransferase n=2 Tax=Mammaliicoccus sciuri TaxID=1296 RepID=A0AAI8GV91_MAMSC|nr:N-acetyltransferase [Mammaliicoccus sciuri]